jgi:hypothetical protein
MGRSESSVRNYDYSMRNNPEERSCQIPIEICYGNILSRTIKLQRFRESSWVIINFLKHTVHIRVIWQLYKEICDIRFCSHFYIK